MFKWICLGAALLVALFLGWRAVISDGALLEYLDRHPTSVLAPAVPMFAAHYFYSLRQYEPARLYFHYVAQRFPDTKEAEEAEFYALHCQRLLDDVALTEMAPLYEAYARKYPEGRYTPAALALIKEAERRSGT